MNITKIVNTNIFRKNLKFYRKKRGYSLAKLSELTGLSIRMLSYYELYATNIPIDKLELIANSLNVSINKLIGTKSEPNENNINKDELLDVDTRTLQKIKDLLSLPPQDRAMVYSMINTLIETRRLKQKKIKQPEETNQLQEAVQ